MKKSLILTFGILISLVSCKEKVTDKQIISDSKPTIELKTETVKIIESIEKVEGINIPEQYVENDSLLFLLKSELNKLALKTKFDLKTEPIINKYEESIMDTIKTLTFDKTKIYSYRATNWESIYEAKIENSEFKFLDSIKIGIQKKTLERLLKIELDAESIQLGNLEQTSVFIFTFEDDILKTIDYQGYVD